MVASLGGRRDQRETRVQAHTHTLLRKDLQTVSHNQIDQHSSAGQGHRGGLLAGRGQSTAAALVPADRGTEATRK